MDWYCINTVKQVRKKQRIAVKFKENGIVLKGNFKVKTGVAIETHTL